MRLFDPDDTEWVVGGVLAGAAMHMLLTSKLGVAAATGITSVISVGGILAGKRFEQVCLLSPFSLGIGLGESANIVQILINYALESLKEETP